MQSEIRESTEAKAIKSGGFELPALAVSNEQMVGFSRFANSSDRSSARDREQEMFGAGFSFENGSDIYSSVQVGEKQYDRTQVVAGPVENVKGWADKTGAAVSDSAEHTWFPYRGKEDTKINYTACAAAFRAFPEFADHPNIDRALIPALIRNELNYYNLKEKPIEGIVNAFGDLPKDTLSIGPAQIQKQNIERLMLKFPQLSDPELGGITGNPLEAALDPAKAPWFVAALLAERMQNRDEKKQPVTHQDLIQSYNPGGKVHFNHVHDQLIWIKTNHGGW